MFELPEFYLPAHAADYDYRPDAVAVATAANEARRRYAIAPASSDRRRVHLLLIDVQKDFCFPDGTLYVAGRSGRGALDDSQRIAELIYRNVGSITDITTTLDSHLAYQIFFASFWVDRDDQPLTAHQTVTIDRIMAGEVRPHRALAGWLTGGDDAALSNQVTHYARELARAGKYQLYLWPPHCLIGSDGHAVVGAVHAARLFHSYARVAQSHVELKGQNPLTENYSVLRPEVVTRYDGGPLAEANRALLDRLLAADALVIAGQAASHCVKSTIDDVLDAIVARDRALARKVYIVTDCMSAVTVPDGRGGWAADFTPQAEAALARYAEAGMRLVRSTDPITAWPG